MQHLTPYQNFLRDVASLKVFALLGLDYNVYHRMTSQLQHSLHILQASLGISL